MVERALRAAGYRTGRYTSPHLVDLEERFALDGRSIALEELDRLAARIEQAAASLPAPPSFFEATTALALEAFRAARVDVAVLEVGLGGRLDATNAVASTAAAITAVDFDHEAYLGHTLEAIAGEKAGIIKASGLAVLGENPVVVREVVSRACDTRHARLVYAPDGVAVGAVMTDGRTIATLTTPRHTYDRVRLSLRGRHQIANAVVATRLLEELAAGGLFTIPASAIRTGLERVEWPGRLEWRQWRGHDVLIDGAHNPAGARALAAYVQEAFGRPLPCVVGAMSDKHVSAMLSALAPIASRFVCTAAASRRASPPEAIAALARAAAPIVPVETVASPIDAVAMAVTHGEPVIVAGSLYLAGEIRAKLS
jgi:dihydrofolate synthase/folylpolyglutamate synthase